GLSGLQLEQALGAGERTALRASKNKLSGVIRRSCGRVGQTTELSSLLSRVMEPRLLPVPTRSLGARGDTESRGTGAGVRSAEPSTAPARPRLPAHAVWGVC